MSADNTATAVPKKSRKKLVLLIVAGLVLAGASAGGAWYMGQRGKAAEPHGAAAAPKAPAQKPVFAPLEVFTVNLQDGRGERYAQIGMTLQLDSPAAEELLKDRIPAVRNEVLLLIASKHIDELLTDEGKRELARQVRERAGQILALAAGSALPARVLPASTPAATASAPAKAVVAEAANMVQDVLFSQFIVQ